jgi:hypothetical protein
MNEVFLKIQFFLHIKLGALIDQFDPKVTGVYEF